MITKILTTQSISEVMKSFEKVAKENSFGVLHQYQYKELLKERGFEIESDIVMYEICNPLVAHQALNENPDISVFMPCRVSVYETKEGVVLETIDFSKLIDVFEISIDLKEKMHNVYNNILSLMGYYKNR